MREKGSQSRSCVVPVAVVAGLGMAGMGLVSSEIAVADITSVTDTINVTVALSCTFNSVVNKTYVGSAANGAEVNNFNDSGVHEFNLFCNGSNGYAVTATPYDLEATGIERVISYTDDYTPSGTNGLWTAAIASDAEGVTVVPIVPVGGGTIISSDSGTTADGVNFTATYSAYVGTETPAGTYTGTIVYTLTALEASNSGSNSDNNGGGTDSGNEATENTEGGSDSGDSGSGNANSGSTNSDANSGDSSNASSNAPLATTLNNSYSTYNTYNNYNTTNYTSSGTGTASTQATTSENTNGTTSGNNNSENSSEANDDYEQPLGVTTNTSSSSSNKNSETDPMPLIVAGVLAAAGVAGAVALARSNKEEE